MSRGSAKLRKFSARVNVFLSSVRSFVAMARVRMVLVVVALAMLAMGTETAETPPNCNSAWSELLPCYSYVTGSDAKPPVECCGGLGTLNSNNPTCLCQLITQFNSSTASEPKPNMTKAFNLPNDCAITLKTSDCPALANLPLAPPVGINPTPPGTTSPGPTAGAGPENAVPGNGNDGGRLLPAILVIGVVTAAVAIQAFL